MGKRTNAGQAMTFENDKIVVHGFMESDTYSPLFNISVIPQTQYRLAPAIWKKMYDYPPTFLNIGATNRTLSRWWLVTVGCLWPCGQMMAAGRRQRLDTNIQNNNKKMKMLKSILCSVF